MDFSAIPLIDFAPFLHGDDTQRRAVAAQIGAACRNSGFFYLKNHGIEADRFARIYQAGKRFYQLPLEAKMEVAAAKSERLRGYTPMLGEKLSAKGDLKECFDIALEIPADDPDIARGARLYGPNQWPKNMGDFQDAVYQNYYLPVLKLGRHVLEAFALALDLPADHFAALTRKPMCNLRILHYPPQDGVIDADMLGCGAHTDYECFTLLAQSDTGGLQVCNLAGEWIEAPPIEGTLVVNIGDMMAHWTNDEFASTPHRVINRSGRERYSLPFFFGADYFAELECLPTCQSADNPPRYPPIVAGDYLRTRYDSTFTYRERAAPDAATSDVAAVRELAEAA